MSVFEHSDYRSFLKDALGTRQQRNRRYSMRGFAKALGVTEAAVSQVLAGKRNFSVEKAFEIATHLQLDEKETEFFVVLVQAQTAKGSVAKRAFERKLESLHPEKPRVQIDGKSFLKISDWYHFVLLYMSYLDDVDFSPEPLARRIGIPVKDARAGLQRLNSLKLIEPDPERPGRFCPVDSTLVRSETMDAGLRRFHAQMLDKAKEALTSQSPQEKVVGSETFALSESCLEEAKNITERYFQKMVSLAKRPGKKTQVYHLGVQFFNMTKETRL